jgi:hypothetical protein
MRSFVQDVERLARPNDEFRKVLYRARNCQLVLMALKPNHRNGVVHHTRADTEADIEHFDGRTSE